MAVTVADVALDLRLITAADEAVEAGVASILTRHLAAAEAIVEERASGAPEAVKDAAIIAMAAFMFDRPSAPAGYRFSRAWSQSGASEMLARYVTRRARAIGTGTSAAPSPAPSPSPEPAASAITPVDVSGNPQTLPLPADWATYDFVYVEVRARGEHAERLISTRKLSENDGERYAMDLGIDLVWALDPPSLRRTGGNWIEVELVRIGAASGGGGSGTDATARRGVAENRAAIQAERVARAEADNMIEAAVEGAAREARANTTFLSTFVARVQAVVAAISPRLPGLTNGKIWVGNAQGQAVEVDIPSGGGGGGVDAQARARLDVIEADDWVVGRRVAAETLGGGLMPDNFLVERHFPSDIITRRMMSDDTIGEAEVIGGSLTEPLLAPAVRAKLNASGGGGEGAALSITLGNADLTNPAGVLDAVLPGGADGAYQTKSVRFAGQHDFYNSGTGVVTVPPGTYKVEAGLRYLLRSVATPGLFSVRTRVLNADTGAVLHEQETARQAPSAGDGHAIEHDIDFAFSPHAVTRLQVEAAVRRDTVDSGAYTVRLSGGEFDLAGTESTADLAARVAALEARGGAIPVLTPLVQPGGNFAKNNGIGGGPVHQLATFDRLEAGRLVAVALTGYAQSTTADEWSTVELQVGRRSPTVIATFADRPSHGGGFYFAMIGVWRMAAAGPLAIDLDVSQLHGGNAEVSLGIHGYTLETGG